MGDIGSFDICRKLESHLNAFNQSAELSIDNFGKRYEDDQKMSKKPSNYFSQQYPSSKPTLPELGGYSGLFGNLAFYVGLGWDPNKPSEYLTDQTDGLFVWDDVSINKLNESKLAGDLKSKQLVYICICYMLELAYSLMLGSSGLAIKAFRPFTSVGSQ